VRQQVNAWYYTGILTKSLSPAARRAVLLLVLFGFALRLSVRLYTGAEDFWSNGYTLFLTLAQNIAARKEYVPEAGFPTAFRVPAAPVGERGLVVILFFAVCCSSESERGLFVSGNRFIAVAPGFR
jgi:hypothetical protein